MGGVSGLGSKEAEKGEAGVVGSCGVDAAAWFTSVELDEFGSCCSVFGVWGAVECGVASEAMVWVMLGGVVVVVVVS